MSIISLKMFHVHLSRENEPAGSRTPPSLAMLLLWSAKQTAINVSPGIEKNDEDFTIMELEERLFR